MKIYLNEETVRDSKGNTYEGGRDRIVKTLVRFGATQQEREHILSGALPISSAALTALKREKSIKQIIAPKPPREEKPFVSPSTKAEKSFNAAITSYCKNWQGYANNTSDIDPETMASDAALGFFHDFPQWKTWASTLMMSKMEVHSIVTDHVYEAMIS